MKPSDPELMQHTDGELEDVELDADARAKVDALGELGELVRGHLELSADAVPDRRFDALWREIDKSIGRTERKGESEPTKVEVPRRGFWRRAGRWFDRYRGHLITGAVSAGAVAALALVLRPGGDRTPTAGGGHGTPQITPAVYRPTEIEELDTPGGNASVMNLKDEDGSTTVIWVTPEDTVEGL
ncbi:MAG: hypothetical protein ACM31C_02360 [Acidobacteriota bacterium]